MFVLIADYLPDYMTELSSFMTLFGGFFAGGVLVVFLGWAIGYAVRALFDMLEFMTL